VIAPKGSAAYDEAIAKGHNFIDTNDVNFTELDGDNNLVYTAGENERKIPLFFVADYWDEGTINKSCYDAPYQFVFDFTNDKIINAKDFSRLVKFNCES
ncbi:MAG: hypothetical protein ACI4IQ_06480, partial [Eubacterium sp.]